MPPRLSPTSDAIRHVLLKTDKTSKLEVKYINAEKGRGVFATSKFPRGEFVVEYRGPQVDDDSTSNQQASTHAQHDPRVDGSHADAPPGPQVDDDTHDVMSIEQASTHAQHDPRVDGSHADVPPGPQVDDDTHEVMSIEQVIKAVKVTCGYDSDSHKFTIPSLAKKIGHTLVKVSKLLKAQGLIMNNHELVKNATEFQEVHNERHGLLFIRKQQPNYHKESSAEVRNAVPSVSKRSKPLSGEDDRLTAVMSVKGKAPRKRKPWQDEEVKAVEKHMKRFITSCIVPSKRDCEKCLRAEPAALNNRDWQMLKYYVYNRITAYKKKVQHS
ncbi:unnamed protein product [Arctogadus glacialis]